MEDEMEHDDSELAHTFSTQSSKKDHGLLLLVPLYKLLRGICAQAIFRMLVTKFKGCKFFIDDLDKDKFENGDLYDFLKAVNSKGTNRQKKVKNKQKNNQKQDNQELDTQKQENQIKTSWQIFNLDDNVDILRSVSVSNMKAANEEQCQPLRNLDLQIVVNILTNAILRYQLSENANKSINEIKEIRNGLYHAKYDFNENDFNKYLKKLQENLQDIYEELRIPMEELSQQIDECKREASQQDFNSDQIFKELQKEIHDNYKLPHYFVSPTIKEASDGEDPYVESLEMYIQNESRKQDEKSKPILLCGKRGSGKTSILQNQAFQLVEKMKNAKNQGNKISLVVLCEEYPQGSLKKENFWQNITNNLKSLAPNTTRRYDIDILQAVIKDRIKETIFLINWNLQEINYQFSETSRGTWVFTYEGDPGKSADWNILLTEPLKDTQVYQLLQYLNPNPQDQEIILNKYKVCNYKDILASPDMVKIFNEVNRECGLGTEFELMIEYVKKKMNEGNLSNNVINAVGKLAFHGIGINKIQFDTDEFQKMGINSSGQLAFFTRNGKYFELIHSSLMDFLASVYVIGDLSSACKDWLKNTIIYKRVFKFVCSFWFRDIDHCWKDTVRKNGNKNEYLIKTEEFLCKLFAIENKREKKKEHKNTKKTTSSSRMEVDKNNQENITNESMDVDVSEVEATEMLMSGNPVKNPFSKWGFLVHIDEACEGIPEVLKMMAKLLSYIKCWIFKCKEWDDSKRRRIQYILNKVRPVPHQNSPIIIKIESGPSCSMLINVWNMIKNTESLHNAVKVKISIMHEKNEGKCKILDDGDLKKLPQVIVNTRAAVYVTELNMPIICPRIPDFKFSMCECIQKLEYLEAIVYDVNSLREVLVCGNLSNLKSIKIYVDLKPSEQRIDSKLQLKIPNPRRKNVNLTLVYFREIQKLLNAFTCRHRLLSLSIRDLVINGDFKLNMSEFKNMESLYLHCNENYTGVHGAFNCPLLLSTNLTLPKCLERLLLSGVQFYDDTNIHLFRKFFTDYEIQRLMILDSNLSLEGAREVLKQHMFEEKETELHLEMNKKMKIDKSDSIHLKELVEKQPRLSKEDRLVKQKKKPKGKEIIITSKTELKNSICNSKPCHCKVQCITMLNPSEILKKILEDLSGLIEDTYCYNILSFAFSNENVIVRKDLCNDLRVHCPLFELQDNDMYQMLQKQIPSNSPIPRLFQSLTLTQSLYVEKTVLTYDGIIALVTIMKNEKRRCCKDNLVEPFSLTITSNYHPYGSVYGANIEVPNSRIIEFLKQESCLQMLNFWCTCDNRCHKLKKTHNGDIYVNDKLIR